MAKPAIGVKELRGMPEAELQAQLEALRRTLWDQRTKLSATAQPKMHEIRATRRQIARAMTLLAEKRRAGGAQ